MKRSFAFSVLLIAVMLVIGAAAVSAQAAKQVPYVGITIFDYTNTFVGYIRKIGRAHV